jgi:DUF917 family protein
MSEKQVKYIRVLLAKEGVSSMEKEFALEFSNGRTNELSDLNHSETQKIIESFVGKSPKDKMQGKIMSIAHEMRWELKSGKVDIKRLDAWCEKHTPFHRQFDKLTVKQLPKVVAIFEKVYESYLKAL